MYTAVILSCDESERIDGDPSLLARVRQYAAKNNCAFIFAKDESGKLHDRYELTCSHGDQYVSDRSEFICRECGFVLGR